jgi:iron(II)-dependent oxidoreductase
VSTRVEIRQIMERAREGTQALLEPVSDDELTAQISPLAPPLVWNLAHVASFEELWLLRTVGGAPPLADAHRDVYEALRRARSNGARLPALRADAVRAYSEDVRERAIDLLEHLDLDSPDALVRHGFAFGLVVQNELVSQEAMLEALQLRQGRSYPVPSSSRPDRAPSGPDEILVPGGTFVVGAEHEPWAYDNELEAHEVELGPFVIDRAPVTNAQFAEFVDGRGYRSPRHWSAAGWEWREREDARAPLYWEGGPEGWERVRFGVREPLPPDEPVQHVSFYEAEAFAHWAGKRLPTEIEWERAATWHDHEGKFRFPWGQSWMGFEASLDRRRFSPAPVGSYAGGVSPVGCVQMAGDVWEWTASGFHAYPGFVPFPGPECSEVNFGDDVRVLRGGSWATDGLVARSTLRRWEHPGRREIFAGFRLARDAR